MIVVVPYERDLRMFYRIFEFPRMMGNMINFGLHIVVG